jgi:homocysteine S-methyltransferase
MPHLRGGRLFVTDGGLETELVFHDGRDLPCFAAFPLLAQPDTRARLRRYYDGYLDIARKHGAGFLVETPTWRASPDWGRALGYSEKRLNDANRAAVELAEDVRAAAASDGIAAAVSGCVGPRGDGYDPSSAMTPGEAQDYHSVQIGIFAETSADQITAMTITNAAEAIGIVRAAAAAGIPAAMSFTVEIDGRLPSGQPLGEAIDQVDAETGAGAAYFMVNCAHPTHFASALEDDGAWRDRLVGLRANSSARSHAEMDEAPSSTRATPQSSVHSMPRCEIGCLRCGCSAAVAARMRGMCLRSSRPGWPTKSSSSVRRPTDPTTPGDF